MAGQTDIVTLAMQKLEINISQQRRALGYAMGETVDGKKVFVRNGDLLKNTKAVICITEEKASYLVGEIEDTYQALESIAAFVDKDSVLPATFISVMDRRIFSEKGKLLFPYEEVRGVLDYVMCRPDLWAISRWALTKSRGVRSAAMWFGVTFKSAIEKLKKENLSTASLYCPHPELFSDRGKTADMLAIVNKDSEGNIVLLMWQGVDDRPETFYVLAIVSKVPGSCSHFDIAIIRHSIVERNRLFSENRIIKGESYRKLFRMDGAFSLDVVYEIANRFFPLDELIDEYFEVEPL